MKKLGLFTYFDWDGFATEKVFACTGCSEWKDFSTGVHLGTKVEAAIIQDTTDYGDSTISNLFEKILFKVPRDIQVPVGVEIQPSGVQASVYGDYRNQLSCTADDIIFQKPKG